jgi:hypothetical protein
MGGWGAQPATAASFGKHGEGTLPTEEPFSSDAIAARRGGDFFPRGVTQRLRELLARPPVDATRNCPRLLSSHPLDFSFIRYEKFPVVCISASFTRRNLPAGS